MSAPAPQTQGRLGRRVLVLLLLVAPVAGLTSFSQVVRSVERSAEEVRDARIPTRIGEWVGREVALTDRALALLGTDRVVFREYRGTAGGSVHLCVVRSSAHRARLHPPEVCYRGWGYEIVAHASVPLASPEGRFEANLLRLDKPDHRLLVLYWYRSGGHRSASFLEQQIRSTVPGWLGGSEDGALVRLSTALLPEEDPRPALDRLLRFADDFSRLETRRADVQETRHPTGR